MSCNIREYNGIILNDLYIFSEHLTLPALEIYRFQADNLVCISVAYRIISEKEFVLHHISTINCTEFTIYCYVLTDKSGLSLRRKDEIL